ncbi:MAG: hypothetical protein ISS56_20405 [Anaerolineae bacterium]|jgi:hypothetical protein|nr:hypothetical protein [Anaerolineae bacterium]
MQSIATEREERMIAHLVEWIQDRGLRSPAILFLEAHKPLAPIGSQALLFLQPLLRFVGPMLGWFDDDRVLAEYALLLEDPTNVERVLSHLEHCLAE